MDIHDAETSTGILYHQLPCLLVFVPIERINPEACVRVQVHKMYAGLLDVYHYNGNQQALDIVINMTDIWLIPYVSMPIRIVRVLTIHKKQI